MYLVKGVAEPLVTWGQGVGGAAVLFGSIIRSVFQPARTLLHCGLQCASQRRCVAGACCWSCAFPFLYVEG